MRNALAWVLLSWFAVAAVAADPKAETEKPRSREQRLLDILLERQIITQAEHAELSAISLESDAPDPRRSDLESRVEEVLERGYVDDEEQARAGFDEGFYIESADGLYSLRFRGWVQVRYTYSDFDSGRDKSDESSFSTPQVRVDFLGHVYDPNLTYRIFADFDDDSDDGKTALQDAWVQWFNPNHHYGIRAGQYIVPYGRQQMTPAADLQLMDRAESSVFFTPFRDVGVMFFGDAAEGKFQYWAGVYNGEGEDLENNDNDHLWAARIQANPFGPYGLYEGDVNYSDELALSFGANYAYLGLGDDDSEEIFGTATDGDQHRFAFDAAMRLMGLSLTGEYYTMRSDDDGGGSADLRTVDDHGYFVQSGYFLLPNQLEVAARYSWRNSDNDNLGADDDTEEIGLGLNYYFNKHNHKLQLDWRRLDFDAQSGDDLTDHFVRLQWQLRW